MLHSLSNLDENVISENANVKCTEEHILKPAGTHVSSYMYYQMSYEITNGFKGSLPTGSPKTRHQSGQVGERPKPFKANMRSTIYKQIKGIFSKKYSWGLQNQNFWRNPHPP